MSIIKIEYIYSVIFALLVVINLWVYIFYPLLVSFLREYEIPDIKELDFSIVKGYHLIALFDEEVVIEQKVQNSMNINAPFKITTVLIIDKSTDKSYELAKKLEEKYENLVVLNKGYRMGKNDSLNFAMLHLKPREDDLLFFSDANTMFRPDGFLPLIEKLNEGYALVGGSMGYTDMITGTAIAEGAYWKYEEWIRKSEGKIGRVLVVNGGNFLMRAKYFKHLPDHVANDLEAPLRLCGAGVPVGFAPESIGYEPAVLHDHEEASRKKRMAVQQMSCIKHVWKHLDNLTRIQIIIRKVLRWCGFHIALTTIFLAIVAQYCFANSLWDFLGTLSWIVLIIFISLFILYKKGNRKKIVSFNYHIYSVHTSCFLGMWASIFGNRVSVWEKVESNRLKN